jgi:hypothetical protein
MTGEEEMISLRWVTEYKIRISTHRVIHKRRVGLALWPSLYCVRRIEVCIDRHVSREKGELLLLLSEVRAPIHGVSWGAGDDKSPTGRIYIAFRETDR